VVVQRSARIAVWIRIISPAEDSGVGNVSGEQIAKPVNPICRCPGLVAMPVRAVYGDNVDYRLGSLCHDLETLRT
jgi:hypothetical protein